MLRVGAVVRRASMKKFTDILSRIPSRWRIKRNLGLLDVGLLVNPKAALASHAFLTSSYDGVVCKRRLEFLNSIDAVGMRPSPAPIYPKQMLLANDDRAHLGPNRARTGAPGSCGACGH
ncbi:hypothetical protein H5410_015207 [Solanum commersonii]|uniref:Uncharacterized protein n=1 Tax=Solanum commersonii TaxID=4109 RepID=A0A9J5ZTS6_SOLCO|nr:hypothetical protein H5410_015207 [Solanum commersonii]